MHYVRGIEAMLRVYNGTIEIEAIALHTMKSKEDLHATMRRYFTEKSPEELQQDSNYQEMHRKMRALQKFHREEYLRIQKLYVDEFRRIILQGLPVTWVRKDWLCENYDKINRGFARTKGDLKVYAEKYLAKHAPSQQ